MPQARFLILAQNLSRVLGSAAFRSVTLALVLAFAGVITAFGIAPNTVTDTVTRSKVVENVALPAAVTGAESAESELQSYWREERVQRGDTLSRILSRLRINDDEATAFLNTAAEARPLFQLVPGRTIRAATDADGKLLSLLYLNGERVITVTRDGEIFSAENAPAQFETRVVSAAGEIRSSLFAATDALNIPDAIALQMVELFSTEIDFHKDLRRNDRFSVVYELLHDGGEAVSAGRVLSAEFVNQDRTLNVVWFETAPGQGAYYTLDGRDIRKSFLRSPLEFSRVSSGFSASRFHPILRSWTAHKGVDYVAPIGTKIKATADGIVEFAGVQSGYGNVVILRHQTKYTTLYAHMSGFGRDVQRGAKVQQGDVIGFVGMTGMTTGPHVHYEFRINDVHHDPLTVAMPQVQPIAPELKQKFLQVAAPLSRTMHLMRDSAPSTFE